MSAPQQPVTADESAAILRLHHVEGWPVGTIADQIGRHHDTVERVLAHGGLPIAKQVVRTRLVDPFVPFIEETLAKYARLRASRLWAMVIARGYTGSKSGFRAIVSRLRPRRHAEAYLRRAVLPGEEAQVDWAHFGKIVVGRAQRDLFAFVMVLSFSRLRFVHFAMRAAMPSFLRGHVESFRFFGAVPRVILYDNLKSAVLEREGDAVRFHPTMLALASHYRFEPRACAPCRPNEKGRVERAIRDVREGFSPRGPSHPSRTSTRRRGRGATRSRATAASPTPRTRRSPTRSSMSCHGWCRCPTTTSRSRRSWRFASARRRTRGSTETTTRCRTRT